MNSLRSTLVHLAGLAAGAVLFVAPVLAQSSDTSGLMDRLERMERELSTLQRQVYRGGPAPAQSSGTAVSAAAPVEGSYAAQAEIRFSQLDGEMRQLTGKMEELGHNIDQLRSRLEKLVSDVDFRLRTIEQVGQPAAPATAQATQPGAQPAGRPPQGAGANPGQAPSTEGVLGTLRQGQGQGAPADPARPPAPPQQAALPAGPPDEQYKFAFDTLARQRDYVGAERAFRAFIKANPNHGLAGNAQYWLGETHYARKEFDKAAVEFAEGFKKYPKDSKAPDNVLKLGMSLSALNQTAEACKALQGFEQRFPGDGQNLQTLRERAAREHQRMACK
ncbi:MAG: tol-pal system protein YbgF [Alphaproteobacteria bacterium]|nr:tol-pal system protein YbgF [Alphaproteobacteria bacterium]